MGNIYEGNAQLLVHLLKFNLHILAHLKVKGSQWLIQKEHLRLIGNSPCNGNPLLLSSRQRLHIPVLIICHAHHLEHPPHTLVNLRSRNLLQLEPESNILIHIQMRKQSIALENSIHRTLMRRNICIVLTVNLNLTLISLPKTCQQP